MAEMKKRWYVLRTIGGKEKKVKEYIENEIASLGLQDYVSQVLVPAEKVYQVRNGKKYSSERNLYPGYVLIDPHSLEKSLTYFVTSRMCRLPGGNQRRRPCTDASSRGKTGSWVL